MTCQTWIDVLREHQHGDPRHRGESQRLTEAQTACGEQAEQRGASPSPHPGSRTRVQACCCSDDAFYLFIAVEVGRTAPIMRTENPLWGNFRAGIRGTQPDGEAPHMVESRCPSGWRGAGGRSCPAQGELDCQHARPFRVEKVDESPEIGPRLAEPRTEPTTKGEIRVQDVVEGAHSAPRMGQGSATSRRASKSSFA